MDPHESISPCAASIAAASASSRVEKRPLAYPAMLGERAGERSIIVYSQTHVPSFRCPDLNLIDCPLYLDSVMVAPLLGEHWNCLVWACDSRHRSARINNSLPLSECRRLRLFASCIVAVSVSFISIHHRLRVIDDDILTSPSSVLELASNGFKLTSLVVRHWCVFTWCSQSIFFILQREGARRYLVNLAG